jgi:hypothetical protein
VEPLYSRVVQGNLVSSRSNCPLGLSLIIRVGKYILAPNVSLEESYDSGQKCFPPGVKPLSVPWLTLQDHEVVRYLKRHEKKSREHEAVEYLDQLENTSIKKAFLSFPKADGLV